MTGAAGGLAGGLWACFGAELAGGAGYVCDLVDLDRRARAADLVVTGEGRLDETTLEGKVVAEVARRASAAGTPVHAVVGTNVSSDELRAAIGLDSTWAASTPEEIAARAVQIAAIER
jgi:glycerate kinase